MIPTIDMFPAGELKPIQELTILSILRGERPLDFTRSGADDLFVRVVSAQPEFQIDQFGYPISASLLEQRVKEHVFDFRRRCTANPASRVCNSVVKTTVGDVKWKVYLYNYSGRQEMELLPKGCVRLGIECTPPLEDRIDEVRRKMISNVSDPSPWL